MFYNNINDIDVVFELVVEFDLVDSLVVVIIKYVNLCGVVIGVILVEVY